jgi:hypothetical protein
MDMQDAAMNIPGWLTPVAWVFVGMAALSALAVLDDIYRRGHRQERRSLEALWVVSALWLGPLTLPLYRSARRRSQRGTADLSAGAHGKVPARGLAGGAASLVAHIVGVPLVLLTGLTIAGLELFAMIAVIAVLAIGVLFAFEYAGLAGDARRRTALVGALVAAAVTVAAFDVGMGGWMLLLHFNALMPPVSDITFIFLMQVGIALGFVTAYPAVVLLRGRTDALGVPAHD